MCPASDGAAAMLLPSIDFFFSRDEREQRDHGAKGVLRRHASTLPAPPLGTRERRGKEAREETVEQA
ncbi:hypothetical protein MRX96_035160 [Rhipicephalus microplus]